MAQKLVLMAIGILICVVFLAVFNRLFKHIYKRKNAIYIKFINSVATVVVIIVCVYYCLSLFDVTKDMSRLLLQSSTLLIALITFTAQQALGNVISGFSISMAKPFDVNEKVKVVNGTNIIAEGIITDITIRHTIIRTFDGQTAIVPNSIMDSSVIINTNYTENVGNFLEVEISYSSDAEKATEIIKKLAIAHKNTLNDDNMIVTASALTDNGIILKTTIWTPTLSENFLACSDLRKEIVKEFQANGIVIPYNTITIDQ